MKKIFIFLFLAFVAENLCAQNPKYTRYIDRYADMAVEQMKSYGIPASITLAQGLLESAAGTSRLATRGNNHFGIKVGGTWKGPYMLADDDAPNEKFRVYKSVRESYEDHSVFLRCGRRYASLFQLDPTDYKGWAHGLKKAGYATHPHYAHSLISLIECYDLHRFDGDRRRHVRKEEPKKEKGHKGRKERHSFGRPIYRCNGQYYVLAEAGDTYASLASRMRTKEEKLRTYNDVDAAASLKPGDIVYLGKKARRASESLPVRYHVMQAGESLHGISQQYGIRLRSLCGMNKLRRNEHFGVGSRIRLR